MSRPSLDEWYMAQAHLVAQRSTCSRRAVGAIIIDNRGFVLSQGYNGVPSKYPHCTGRPCAGVFFKSGEGLDECHALHAEQNAVARLREPFLAEAIYVTDEPCVSCTKLLLATSIQRVVFERKYARSGVSLWLASNRIWEQMQADEQPQDTQLSIFKT